MNIFEAEGVAEKGGGRGKKLGFPTVNIPCAGSAPSGIYAGEVVWNGKSYPAAVYKEDGKNIVEAHLLDFSGNLYGETIKIIAREKIRDVKKFQNEKDLIAAISGDIANIRNYFKIVKRYDAS